jgi:hypothetical protein
VFEVASGTLLLRQELLQALASSPAQASAVLINACTAALQHLLQHLKVWQASECTLLLTATTHTEHVCPAYVPPVIQCGNYAQGGVF